MAERMILILCKRASISISAHARKPVSNAKPPKIYLLYILSFLSAFVNVLLGKSKFSFLPLFTCTKRRRDTFLIVFFSLVRKERKGTFLLSYFCMTKSTKSHQRERSPLFENSPCRLAATSANKVPRPSRYSLATVKGSKRPRADSDSLLCHVRLRRTSRLDFGCISVCEHSVIEFTLAIHS